MPDYTIEQVVEAGDPYPFKNMTLVPYTLMLEGESQPVVLNQKDDSQPPAEGAVLTGKIEETDRGRKFRKEYQQSFSGGGNGGGGADNFERRPDHPETQKRMRHTSALSAAPAYYQLLREEGVQDKPADKAEMLNTLTGLIQWLEGTYPAS